MLKLPLLPRLHRRATAWLAVCALLLAQAIGLAHGIAHPHSRGGLPAWHPEVAADASAGASVQSHDDGSEQCRLLDQLAHADLLLPSAFDAPLPASVQRAVAAPRTEAPTLLAWRRQARGPPSFLA